MLCEKCQQRPANVHVTRCSVGLNSPRSRVVQHLCEICAGHKTEQQLREEEEKRKQQKAQGREATVALIKLIHGELFAPRFAMLREKGFVRYGTAICREWSLYLAAVNSRMSGVDPMELLFGTTESGKNHIVRQAQGCEVHLIRWDPDPNQMMSHIFEPFPNAGARLDLSQRLLYVEAELDVFPNSFRSLTFCNLAASMLSTCGLAENQRIDFRFQAQKSPRFSDAVGCRENSQFKAGSKQASAE
jgi:hypothetical protein